MIFDKNKESLIKSSSRNLKCLAKVKFSHMPDYETELGFDLVFAPLTS